MFRASRLFVPLLWSVIGLLWSVIGLACGPAASGDAETIAIPPPASASPSLKVARPEPEPEEAKPRGKTASYQVCLEDARAAADLVEKAAGAADYQAGMQAEQNKHHDEARKSYFKLVRDNPQSPLVPHTYFAFGVLFQIKSAEDPSDWSFAEQSFEQVLKYPHSPILPFARVELARSQMAQGKWADALGVLSGFFRSAATEGEGCSGVDREAEDQLVVAFSNAGDPGKAHEFFSHLSSGAAATRLCLQLVKQYQTTGHHPEALQLAADLAQRHRGASAEACREVAKLHKEIPDLDQVCPP